MITAGWILITIVLVLLMLLAIPISLSFFYSNIADLPGYIHVRWFFGLIDFRSRFPPQKSASLNKISSSATPVKHIANKPEPTLRGLISVFTQSEFRQHIIRYLKKLLQAMHAQNLYFKLRLGLDDPADTGMLWAVLGPFAGLLKNMRLITIDITPVFTDSVFQLKSHGQFQFIPLQFILIVLAFIFSPASFKAWRFLQRAKS